MQKQLKAEEDLMNTMAQIARLSSQKEESSQISKRTNVNAGGGAAAAGGGAGGGVIKGTWKKLKEKRLKKRNSAYTEPPSTQADLEASDKKTTRQSPAQKSKPKKQKENLVMNKEETKARESVETSSTDEWSGSRTDSKNNSLTRKEDEKTPEDHMEPNDIQSDSLNNSNLTSSESPNFAHAERDLPPLVQEIVIEDQLSSSESQNFVRPERDLPFTEDHTNSLTVNDRDGLESISPIEDTDGPSFEPQDLSVYERFGDDRHRKSLRKIQEFLESTGENEPVDLTVLREWDGWMVASRDVV